MPSPALGDNEFFQKACHRGGRELELEENIKRIHYQRKRQTDNPVFPGAPSLGAHHERIIHIDDVS